MQKTILFTLLCICFATTIYAQDEVWQPNADNSTEYNCTTLPIVLAKIKTGDPKSLASIGDMIIARIKDNKTITVNNYIATKTLTLIAKDAKASITSSDLFAEASTACNPKSDTTPSNTSIPVDEFNIVVKGNVNVRSCAGTKCSIVQNVKDGSIFTVVALDGDWYEIKVGDGTAFVLSSLTTRGPDDILTVGEAYLDVPTGCFIVFDMKRGDMDVNLILSGKKQSDILVDIYRPKETRPLKVEAQLEKSFTDTNEPYIYQYYAYNVSWPSQGTYQLELTLNGTTRKLAWEFETRGDYNIFIQCD